MEEARRQYEDQKKVAQPIVDAQLKLMQQGIDQGNDYYDYMKSRQRPIEDQLQADALKDNSARDQAEIDAISAANNKLGGQTADMGRRQQEAGMEMASQLRKQLGEVDNQYGQDSAAALAEMRAAAGGIRSKSSQYEGKIGSEIDALTSGNAAIRDRFGADIEQEADRATADARAGQSQAQAAAMRQALRLGLDPSTVAQDISTAQAGQIAAAATGARNSATDKFRSVIAQGIGLRQNLMNSAVQGETAAADISARAGAAGLDVASTRANMGANRVAQTLSAEAAAKDRGFAGEASSAQILAQTPTIERSLRMQNDATSTAKKMDIAGMYRGMSGASQGAYGMAMGAGNAANSNNAAAGNTLMQNMSASNGLQMSGRQLAMSGLTNILNNQTAYANANQGESFGSLLGGIGGAATGIAKAYTTFGGSDRRLKVGIEQVGRDERTGLHLYEFAYKWAPEFRYRGVMADEVLKVNPAAVSTDEDGFMSVDYGMLGLEMTEV